MSAPPEEEEEIRLRAVWLAESYPPLRLGSLLRSLRRLTQGKGSGLSSPQETTEWLEASLDSGSTGFSNLGVVVPPGSHTFAHADPIEMALPSGVEYGFAGVHILVPSYALLVMCFVFDESAGRRIERKLRADYSSYEVSSGSWTAVHGPLHQKRDAVRDERRLIRAELSECLTREAPGLFAQRRSRLFPSVEFWTTKVGKPFDEQATSWEEMHSYLSALGWIRGFDQWADDESALTLASTSARERRLTEDSLALELVGKEEELFAGDDLKSSGGRTTLGYVNRLEDIASFAAVWALRATARAYESDINLLRERLRLARRGRMRARVQAIHDVQTDLLELRADLEPLAAELARSSDRLLPLFRRRSRDFRSTMPRRSIRRGSTEPGDGPSTDYPEETRLELLAFEITNRMKRLGDITQQIGNVSSAMVEALSAQANLRLQRWVTYLTVVVAIIGIATLAVILFVEFADSSTDSDEQTRTPVATYVATSA